MRVAIGERLLSEPGHRFLGFRSQPLDGHFLMKKERKKKRKKQTSKKQTKNDKTKRKTKNETLNKTNQLRAVHRFSLLQEAKRLKEGASDACV